MKANIKQELKDSAPTEKKQLEKKKWGPLTPGQWVGVAFVFFALSMFYGDKESFVHGEDNEVVPPPSELVSRFVGKLDSGAVELDESEVVAQG